MTGAEKRSALLALEEDATRERYGRIAATLERVASLNLDDHRVCKAWARLIKKDRDDHNDVNARAILTRACDALLDGVPS